MKPRRDWAIAIGIVLAAVALISVPRLTNVEVFMRMAFGRLAFDGHIHFAREPFTFTVDAPFANPEWLGDVFLYSLYRIGGEAGLIVGRIGLVAIGNVLLLVAIRRAGATLATATLLVCCVVTATNLRWVERNELQLVWLVPTYVLLLQSTRPALWWVLVPLGVVWTNAHGSFVVAWALVFAYAADAWVTGQRRRAVHLTAILALHPLMPLLSPDGLVSVYEFVLDHQRHSKWLEHNIAEWLPWDSLAATPREASLHLFVAATLLSFLARKNRREVGRFILAVAGIAFTYRGARFAPLGAALLAIPLGANLAGITVPRRVRIGAFAVLAAAALYLGWTAREENAKRPHPLAPGAGAADAARWIGQHARPGARVFHPYNQAQLLMWFAPQVKLTVTAHPPWIGWDEWKAASTSAPAFEALLQKYSIDYVLAYRDPRSTAPGMWTYLEHHPRLQRVYTDEVSAVYAPVPARP